MRNPLTFGGRLRGDEDPELEDAPPAVPSLSGPSVPGPDESIFADLLHSRAATQPTGGEVQIPDTRTEELRDRKRSGSIFSLPGRENDSLPIPANESLVDRAQRLSRSLDSLGLPISVRTYVGALLAHNVIRQQDLEKMLVATGGDLLQIYDHLRDPLKIPESVLIRCRATSMRMEWVDVNISSWSPKLVQYLDPSLALAQRAVPVSTHQSSAETLVVTYAVAVPLEPSPRVRSARSALDDFARINDWEAVVLAADPSRVDSILNAHFNGVVDVAALKAEELLYDQGTPVRDISQLDLANPVFRVVHSILTNAVRNAVSDVHLQPEHEDDTLQVRYRLDGRMYTSMTVPAELRDRVVAVMIGMFGMDASERRGHQDGGSTVLVDGLPVEVRANAMTVGDSHDGRRKVTLRLLAAGVQHETIADLGFAPDSLRALQWLFARPSGAFVVSGATGSGKSSTLHSGLRSMDRRSMNVVSIEDPIERRIPGVTHFAVNERAVNERARVTFASTLRSVLRADPDVILVGEIRDPDTAKTACDAASTGHLVLTTVHANDAASVPARLAALGVPADVVASTLRGAMSQALVRRLCTHCRVTAEHSHRSLRDAGLTDDNQARLLGQLKEFYGLDEPTVFEASSTGCGECTAGYSGRMAVAEVVVFTRAQREIISNEAGAEHRLRRDIRGRGVRTMREDGLLRVLAGLTSVSELERVFGFDADFDDD
ncbi:hypothetical protein GKE82_24500 [Conexibacter sp. W3-3-2]|uniref:GspE/PulE family protein n=1 Tax=Conexibacter sp. W3-3-2 TaxID=2675227 RepID=UPI0012B90209|nr:ATPase, T2SS/T4P/T4SS family [Conexibacter sp. W3-3-2]MTD47371.1 hypothetical protein [Conexibacter sp. W3-3-2]